MYQSVTVCLYFPLSDGHPGIADEVPRCQAYHHVRAGLRDDSIGALRPRFTAVVSTLDYNQVYSSKSDDINGKNLAYSEVQVYWHKFDIYIYIVTEIKILQNSDSDSYDFLSRIMWTAGCVAAMGSVTYPAISAFASSHAEPDQQGTKLTSGNRMKRKEEKT